MVRHRRPQVPHAVSYVLVMCLGLPAMLAFLAHRYTSEGLGWTRPIMFTAAVGLAVNVAGNWVFTLGNLGMPRLGATGCAIATVLAQWSMLATMHLYQRRHHFYRRFGAVRALRVAIRAHAA
jgi:multidrug resistance protein, MATE family